VPPLGVEAVELGERLIGVGGGVDRPQRGGDLLLVAVVDVAQRGADEMHDAGLHPRPRKGRLDRLRKALQTVDAGDQDVLNAAAPQVVQDGQPEFRALAVLPPDPEHLALAVTGDAEGEVAGAVLHRAVLADADHHRVEVDDRIHGVQRPGPPRLNVLEHDVGDPRDRVAPDLGAVQLGEVGADVADGHAARVEREDLVVQAGQARLALGQDLRRKAAVAVAGRLDLDGPEIGLHRLGGRAVADVGAMRTDRPAGGPGGRSARPPTRPRRRAPRAGRAGRPGPRAPRAAGRARPHPAPPRAAGRPGGR
jgi:hypothetical protein